MTKNENNATLQNIRPVRKNFISDQVYEQMKEQFINGNWKPGEKLPSETELAGIFQVSRITIRNALQRLNAQGLIETRFGEGSFVREADIGEQIKSLLLPEVYLEPHSVEEVLTFRSAIEVETAGIAALQATDEQIGRLKEFYERHKSIKRSETDDYAQMDLDFHYTIAEMTNNSLIIATYEVLGDILRNAMQKIVEAGLDNGLPFHKRLVEAIEAKDEHKAIVTMKKHMKATIEAYQKLEK
ncbi:MAG: FadR family transcriptional regulator [Lachnospiraceae bacterium]|nr:FadR family transcriptional regulator [Lachnospiraceae bacterium]